MRYHDMNVRIKKLKNNFFIELYGKWDFQKYLDKELNIVGIENVAVFNTLDEAGSHGLKFISTPRFNYELFRLENGENGYYSKLHGLPLAYINGIGILIAKKLNKYFTAFGEVMMEACNARKI